MNEHYDECPAAHAADGRCDCVWLAVFRVFRDDIATARAWAARWKDAATRFRAQVRVYEERYGEVAAACDTAGLPWLEPIAGSTARRWVSVGERLQRLAAEVIALRAEVAALRQRAAAGGAP